MTEAAQGQLLDGLAAATYDTDREQFTVDQLGNRFNEFIVGSVVGGGTTAVLGGADRLMSGEPLSGRKATEAVADETIKAQSPFTFEYQRLDFEGQPRTESGPISAATEEEARAMISEYRQSKKGMGGKMEYEGGGAMKLMRDPKDMVGMTMKGGAKIIS